MEQFQELYDKLFRSKDLKSYTDCLAEIAKAVQSMEAEAYKPTELKLRAIRFPGKCEAYVCISKHVVFDRDGRPAFTYMAGSVLARQKHWDRDKYLNTFPIAEYVAGGPLENVERRVHWFPIYLQEDLKKAINFMLELHRAHLMENLKDAVDGFLS